MRWLALVVLVVVMLIVSCRPALREQPSPTSPPPAAGGPPSVVLEKGEALYQANCQSCHGGATGGSMMDIPPRHNQVGHTWRHPDCQLVDVVLNGSGEMGDMMRRMMPAPEGTPRMPSFKDRLSRDEVVSILSYIKTWWTPNQRAAQAEVTRRQC